MSHVLLIGEMNPYGSDPRYALYPEPPNSAGGRMCRVVLGLRERAYLAQYDRVNLCVGKWVKSAAVAHARALVAEPVPRLVFVMLGVKVTDAFATAAAWSRPPEPFSGVREGERAFLCLPHPSGRCRAWNVPGAVERARRLLREHNALYVGTEKMRLTP